jgi:hypothetical protein
MQLEHLAEGFDPDLSLDGADAVEQFTELGTRNKPHYCGIAPKPLSDLARLVLRIATSSNAA